MKRNIFDKIDEFLEKIGSNPVIIGIFLILLFVIPLFPFPPEDLWHYLDKWGIIIGFFTAVFAFRGWYQIKRLRKNEMVPPETLTGYYDMALLFQLQARRDDRTNLKEWLKKTESKKSMYNTDIFNQVKVVRTAGESSSEISVNEELERINNTLEKEYSPFRIIREKDTSILVVSSEDIIDWKSALYHMKRLLTDVSGLISACGVARIHLFYDGPIALAFPIADFFSNRIDIVVYQWSSADHVYIEVGSLSR